VTEIKTKHSVRDIATWLLNEAEVRANWGTQEMILEMEVEPGSLVGSGRQNITRALDYLKDLVKKESKTKNIIWIEGADKSGKSSVVRYLGSKGYHIIDKYPSFPDFKHQWEFFKDHLANFKEAMEHNGNVVIDRSAWTTMVNLDIDGDSSEEANEAHENFEWEDMYLEMEALEKAVTLIVIIIDSEQRIEDEHITPERREKLRAAYKDIHENIEGINAIKNNGTLEDLFYKVDTVIEVLQCPW